MFPLQPSHHELGFGIPTASQGFQIGQDDLIITDYDFSENNLITFSIGSKSTDLGVCGKRQKESSHGCSSKKVMHREVERKRRQQMSTLYASLRSLLPDDQIKGKHSVCDEIKVAASHIKEMEKNIQELKTRRNKLKSSLNSSGGNIKTSNESDNNVTINIVSDGMEILISHSSERADLGLSRVLAELQRGDLNVVNSVSTRTNDRFVYKIQVEARDDHISNHDVLMLRDRLTEAIK